MDGKTELFENALQSGYIGKRRFPVVVRTAKTELFENALQSGYIRKRRFPVVVWTAKTELFENALQSGYIRKRRFPVIVWTAKTELFENALQSGYIGKRRFPVVVWTENFRCVFDTRSPSSNENGLVWTWPDKTSQLYFKKNQYGIPIITMKKGTYLFRAHI